MSELGADALSNREAWTRSNAEYTRERAPVKWAQEEITIPEAGRLLRVGGRLVFMRDSTLVVLCMPDDGPAEERLLRPQAEIGRLAWPDGGVEFHLGHGDWIRLLRDTGFEVEGLWEVSAPPDAADHRYYDFVTVDWARRWPAEEVWKARKVR